MKLNIKKQPFQADAVNAVADCFAGQPKTEGVTYRIVPGKTGRAYKSCQTQSGLDFSRSGFKNREQLLTKDQHLANIYAVQQRQNFPQSTALVNSKVCAVISRRLRDARSTVHEKSSPVSPPIRSNTTLSRIMQS